MPVFCHLCFSSLQSNSVAMKCCGRVLDYKCFEKWKNRYDFLKHIGAVLNLNKLNFGHNQIMIYISNYSQNTCSFCGRINAEDFKIRFSVETDDIMGQQNTSSGPFMITNRE